MIPIPASIIALQIALETQEANARSYRAENKADGSTQAERDAAEIRQAIAILEAVHRGPIWPQPTGDAPPAEGQPSAPTEDPQSEVPA